MRIHKNGDTYSARVGDFFGKPAPTQEKAIANLNRELENYKPLNQRYIRCNDGTVLHLFMVPSHGWNYNIIPPSGYDGKGVGVQGTFQQAIQRALKDAAENHGGIIGD